MGVSDEINELFQYITRYKPHAIELETKMRPCVSWDQTEGWPQLESGGRAPVSWC